MQFSNFENKFLLVKSEFLVNIIYSIDSDLKIILFSFDDELKGIINGVCL